MSPVASARAACGLSMVAAAALALAACNTQRFPGPMAPLVDPLPPGDIAPPPYGPQEILVFRLSDPVQVRRAGENSGFPLAVYQKRERLRSGSSVFCAAGGRCELLWPEDASSVLIFDEGVCDLGEPSRDEPLVTFRSVTRSRVVLTPEDRVALMGGAILRGDPTDTSGPFLIERAREDILRIANQSKRSCTVAFRDEELVLSPGEVMELPLLEAGGAPFQREPEEKEIEAAGRKLKVAGNVVTRSDGVQASGNATVRDLGVEVRLAAGETLVLDVQAAEPEAAPESPAEAPPGEAQAPESPAPAPEPVPPPEDAGDTETVPPPAEGEPPAEEGEPPSDQVPPPSDSEQPPGDAEPPPDDAVPPPGGGGNPPEDAPDDVPEDAGDASEPPAVDRLAPRSRSSSAPTPPPDIARPR